MKLVEEVEEEGLGVWPEVWPSNPSVIWEGKEREFDTGDVFGCKDEKHKLWVGVEKDFFFRQQWAGTSCFLKQCLVKMCILTPPCYSTYLSCLYNSQLRLKALHGADIVIQSVCKLPTKVLGLQNYLQTIITYLSHGPVSSRFIYWQERLLVIFFL